MSTDDGDDPTNGNEIYIYPDKYYKDLALEYYQRSGPWRGSCYNCPGWDDNRSKCHVKNMERYLPARGFCDAYDWTKFIIEHV